MPKALTSLPGGLQGEEAGLRERGLPACESLPFTLENGAVQLSQAARGARAGFASAQVWETSDEWKMSLSLNSVPEDAAPVPTPSPHPIMYRENPLSWPQGGACSPGPFCVFPSFFQRLPAPSPLSAKPVLSPLTQSVNTTKSVT